MWIIQLRALTKGSKEQLQGSEAAPLAKLGLEVQEGFAQVEQQTEMFQMIHGWSKGGGRSERGLLEKVGVILGMRGKPGLCKAEASDLPLSAGRRFGSGE